MSTMIPFKRALRDFVYLDWEKVRSLAAQLLEGIPEDEKREHRQESGVKGRLEASALNLLKGGGEIDYRYFRSNNETRSFHHHVYSLFEDDLIEKSIVTVIEKDFDAERWIPESFYDGQFILVTGLLRIMDYGWVASSMESIPRMQRLSHNAEQHSLQEQVNKGVISRQEMEAKLHKQRKTQGEIKALKIDELTELVVSELRRRPDSCFFFPHRDRYLRAMWPSGATICPNYRHRSPLQSPSTAIWTVEV